MSALASRDARQEPGDPSPSAGGPERPMRGARRELVLVAVTLALVAGASADFLLAQTLKLEPSALERPRVEAVFSPICRCETKERATLAFTVRRPLRVDAQMIDAQGATVRRLAQGVAWAPGRRALLWDGLDDAGRRVPDGPYRLRVRLLDGDRREIIVPTPVTVDTVAPLVSAVSATPRTVTPAPRGQTTPDPIAVRYRANEPARPTLLVDGRAATRRRVRPTGQSVFAWGGRERGRPVRPGVHSLSIRLLDRAGNLGPPSRPVDVRVRRAEPPAASGATERERR